MKTLVERFWSKVDKSGGPDACWPWIAYRNLGGYGSFMMGSRTDGSKRPVLAHRFAYELVGGPLGAAIATHSCDNPGCCNPAHISPGTHASNAVEKVDRGRSLAGVRNPCSKLVAEEVRAVRAASGSQRAIAARFNVSQMVVSRIQRGESYVDV